MLLEMGATLREGEQNYLLKRGALSIETPDGKSIPLAPNMGRRAVPGPRAMP